MGKDEEKGRYPSIARNRQVGGMGIWGGWEVFDWAEGNEVTEKCDFDKTRENMETRDEKVESVGHQFTKTLIVF